MEKLSDILFIVVMILGITLVILGVMLMVLKKPHKKDKRLEQYHLTTNITETTVKGLIHGVYLIDWKEECGGGQSLASVGSMYDGRNWVAPSNWVSKDDSTPVQTTKWSSVSKIKLLYHIPTHS